MWAKLQNTELKRNIPARITKRAEAFQVAGTTTKNWDAPIKVHRFLVALFKEKRSITYVNKGITSFLGGIKEVLIYKQTSRSATTGRLHKRVAPFLNRSGTF
jgi:hypothetical protein